MHSIRRLLREVHRRSVWQVLTVYLAASWVALQVVQTIVDSAQLPEWLPAMALVLLVIGLPVVVATAFVQEGAPGLPHSEAQRRPDDVATPGAPGEPTRSGNGPAPVGLFTWRNAIMGGVGAFALWGVIAAFLISTGRPVGPSALAAADRPGIAVLPLEALSIAGGEDDEAFARGFHDELITRLSKIGALRVTSRTSVMAFAGEARSMRDIARELGVQLLLEGSIQRTGGQIALNVQLIDGATDEHLWAESFQRDYSLENVFSIQRELAEQIVAELELSLSPEDAGELADDAPTENDEAYRLYLQANDFYQSGPRSDDFLTAIPLYERAAEVDPDFALADARFAFAVGQALQVNRFDDEDEDAWYRRAQDAIARARTVDPELPEAALAEAQLLYAVEGNFARALAALNRASSTGLKGDYYHLLGAAQRRVGDFDGAIESWTEMVRVDPSSAHYEEDLGSAYSTAGRFAEAIPHLRTAVAEDPAALAAHDDLVQAYVAVDGSTERAFPALDAAESGTGSDWTDVRIDLLMLDRRFDEALELADPFVGSFILIAMGRSDEARARARELGFVAGWRRETSDSDPLEWWEHEWGAQAAALEGDENLAREQAEAALRALPASRDALGGVRLIYSMAIVHQAVGDRDRALELLEELRRHPSDVSDAELRLNPIWDPVRSDPRFQALLTAGA